MDVPQPHLKVIKEKFIMTKFKIKKSRFSGDSEEIWTSTKYYQAFISPTRNFKWIILSFTEGLTETLIFTVTPHTFFYTPKKFVKSKKKQNYEFKGGRKFRLGYPLPRLTYDI